MKLFLARYLQGGAGQNPARQAAINAGLPKEKPAYIVNQVCGSGLRSVASAYQSIKSGRSKIVLAERARKYVISTSCNSP